MILTLLQSDSDFTTLCVSDFQFHSLTYNTPLPENKTDPVIVLTCFVLMLCVILSSTDVKTDLQVPESEDHWLSEVNSVGSSVHRG